MLRYPVNPASQMHPSSSSVAWRGHAHSSKLVAPMSAVEAPAGHSLHASEPFVGAYVPISHGSHFWLVSKSMPLYLSRCPAKKGREREREKEGQIRHTHTHRERETDREME